MVERQVDQPYGASCDICWGTAVTQRTLDWNGHRNFRQADSMSYIRRSRSALSEMAGANTGHALSRNRGRFDYRKYIELFSALGKSEHRLLAVPPDEILNVTQNGRPSL